MTSPSHWFPEARYGLFIHYGLYSLLARGEWVMNKEAIPFAEYKKLADRFTAEKFDAAAICDLAVRAGMKYIVLTTMHHEGFRLYDTALSNFSTAKTAARRDLVAEVVAAARKRGLRIGLYHSLNNWTDQPDSVAALEDKAAYAKFIENTFARVRELVTKFNPIDVMWYDGWWPFNAEGWRGEEMNAMVRSIQPHILFNGRNGLPGDFATPEGHLGSPKPWRPWEGCMTFNDSWGFHAGDHNWKTPGQIVDLLATCAQGRGNLLLNIGPRGDGSVPEESVRTLEAVGAWLKRGGEEAIFGTDSFTFDLRERGDHRGDWNHNGPFTAKGNALYQLVRRWTGETLIVTGVGVPVRAVTLLGANRVLKFTQVDGKVTVTGLPAMPPDPLCPVLRFDCDRPPTIYVTGGQRTPRVPHPHYDPCPSDLAH
ncbi:MAG: alpha-L-fucosidase [Verrucomicrobiia bacterium]